MIESVTNLIETIIQSVVYPRVLSKSILHLIDSIIRMLRREWRVGPPQAMAAFAADLTDAQIAVVLTWTRSAWATTCTR